MPLPTNWGEKLSLPLVAAPMFLVSGPELVLACCREGVVGTMPALNARSTQGLDQWLSEIRSDPVVAGGMPYGINLIVHRTNERVQADLEVLEKHRVPLVITSLGAAADVIQRVHGWGGVVFHDVTNVLHARKAIAAGADGIIAVAAGAGGHAGTTSPFALIGEIREIFDGTLLLSGSMSRGSDIAAALAMGADLAYMGTRFIATEEGRADAAYKTMVVETTSKDIVYTPAVSGIPANFMRPSLEQAGYDLGQLMRPVEAQLEQKLKPVNDEAKAWKHVWSAGHGVGTIHDVLSVQQLCGRLREEFADAAARVSAAAALRPFAGSDTADRRQNASRS